MDYYSAKVELKHFYGKVQFMNMPVYLIYEIEKRELMARIFLAEKLISKSLKKLDVFVYKHSSIAEIALRHRPGVILFKSCPIQFYPFMRLLKLRGFIIILCQEEGIHYSASTAPQIEFSKLCSQFVDTYLAWHKSDGDFAQKMSIPEDRIRIVGNTRFEMAEKIGETTYKTYDPKPKILILENFTSFKPYKNFTVNNESKVPVDAQIDLKLRVNNLRTESDLNSVLYKKLYTELTKNGFDFKIRKYTVDSAQEYSLEPNLDNSLSIIQAMQDRNIVIHYGSTAGLEAILFKRLSLILVDPTYLHRNAESNIFMSSFVFSEIPILAEFLKNLSESRFKTMHKLQRKNLDLVYETSFRSLETSKYFLEIVNGSRINRSKKLFLKERLGILITILKNMLVKKLNTFGILSGENFIKSSKLTDQSLKQIMSFLELNDILSFQIVSLGEGVKISLNSNQGN